MSLPAAPAPSLSTQEAVVIFSGGQDSATCLAWSLNRFARVHTLGFDYGQRHHVELQCRQRVRAGIAALSPLWSSRLTDDHLLTLDIYRHEAANALTTDRTAPPGTREKNGLPDTFVPGRNLLFILQAAIWAYARGIRHLVTGVCQTDSSGYPDCRDDSIKALQVAINLGMDSRYVLHTPLMWLDKCATWQLAAALGGDALVNCIVEESHTCYAGTRGQRHPWGYGCGQCPACQLRARGYAAYLASKEGSRA
ncbi:7-cyano-7-deazaguanine synthase QueC [uncultured Desulfovibrio sp.]|uniref:7-cyano-7-deazaguanine synthase QueC n=1 Tax=uncultured Desulfovibrio sp. TaxID=167968 RepID=UPI00262D66CD|nr:7-cyano-7-deazaguanine synthase QueC [uncultured Desulfovibrio sp.]